MKVVWSYGDHPSVHSPVATRLLAISRVGAWRLKPLVAWTRYPLSPGPLSSHIHNASVTVGVASLFGGPGRGGPMDRVVGT